MSSANGARSTFDIWNKSKVDLDCFLVGQFRMAGGLILLGGGKLGLRFPAARPLLTIVVTPKHNGRFSRCGGGVARAPVLSFPEVSR